jgi:hypothetical protein
MLWVIGIHMCMLLLKYQLLLRIRIEIVYHSNKGATRVKPCMQRVKTMLLPRELELKKDEILMVLAS